MAHSAEPKIRYNKLKVTSWSTVMKFRLIKPVYAHCDVPCGIYETDSAVHAAATCARMVEKITDLGAIDSIEKQNNFSRMISTKEKHANKVKTELYILWSDYFKPEHLAKFPDLHETIWAAAKQASKVKQTVDTNECQILIEKVNAVAELFAKSKQ